MSDLFGMGLEQPLRVDGAGRLVVSEGEARLWESVERILETSRGSCPLDPEYGVDLVAYDRLAEPERVGWAIAQAIERAEPGLAAIEVELLDDDPLSGTLSIRLLLTPRGGRDPRAQVFPFFRKVTT